MAKLFKRWKRDGKFRRNVILGLILFYIFGGNLGGVGTQALTPQLQCDVYNNPVADFFGIDNDDDLVSCENIGCGVEVWRAAVQIPPFNLNTATKCVSCVEEGKYTRDGADTCCSGEANELSFASKFQFCGDVIGECYKCKSPGHGSITACKSWQKPIAKILDGIWDNDMDCSSKAYLLMGAGVLLVLAVI